MIGLFYRGALAQQKGCCLVTMRPWVQVLETASCRNSGKGCVHKTQSGWILPWTLRKQELHSSDCPLLCIPVELIDTEYLPLPYRLPLRATRYPKKTSRLSPREHKTVGRRLLRQRLERVLQPCPWRKPINHMNRPEHVYMLHCRL
jgi:hypothetical protein